MRKFAFVMLAIGLLAAVYLGTRGRTAKQAHDQRTKSAAPLAPSLVLVDIDGNKIDTSSYAGNVVLINFWAAWCTPCTDEVPKLIAFQEKYRAQGFRVVGISMEDKDSALREFYRKNKMNYPVVAGNEKIAEAYGGILGLPTSVLIGREGSIRAKHTGLADFSALEQEIIALLHANQ